MYRRWLLPVFLRAFVRRLLSNLPLSDYYKTRIWAALRLSGGSKSDWPYYRCVELALQESSRQGTANKFSLLEFGVAEGDGFTRLLHFRDVWARRLGIRSQILAVGFDTFEGLPEPRAEDYATGWLGGDYPGDLPSLQGYLGVRFQDFVLIKGLFSDTLRAQRTLLQEFPPIFVAIDCDYYSSAVDVLQELLPDMAPHGCLFYFDDVGVNFYSDKTGELRAIAEVNAGRFGPHLQLVEFPLWLETGLLGHYKRVYRLVNLETAEKLTPSARGRSPRRTPRRARVSPL